MATVVQGALLGLDQNSASRFSVQSELIFEKSLSTIYEKTHSTRDDTNTTRSFFVLTSFCTSE